LYQLDSTVPLLDTLKACDRHFRAGKFGELGLSNYATWDVAYAHFLCLKHNLKAPTVYQGVMNGICRSMEPELMPAVRTFGMRVYIYNSLAGGMLTDRYQSVDDKVTKGHFSSEFDLIPSTVAAHPYKNRSQLMCRQR